MKKIILTEKTKYIKIDLKKDFFSVFKAVEKNAENCFLFESLGTEANNKDRYSLIGFNPDIIIKAKGKIINVEGISHEVENPYNELRNIMPKSILSQSYPGGMVGYVSYEAANYFEPELNLKLHPDFDQFCFGVYTDGILYDNVTGETSYFHNGNNRLKLLKQIIAKSLKQKAIKNPKVVELGPNVSKIQHKVQVQEVLKEIKAGNTFQCEVGLKINYEIVGSSLPIYEKLRKINP